MTHVYSFFRILGMCSFFHTSIIYICVPIDQSSIFPLHARYRWRKAEKQCSELKGGLKISIPFSMSIISGVRVSLNERRLRRVSIHYRISSGDFHDLQSKQNFRKFNFVGHNDLQTSNFREIRPEEAYGLYLTHATRWIPRVGLAWGWVY